MINFKFTSRKAKDMLINDANFTEGAVKYKVHIKYSVSYSYLAIQEDLIKSIDRVEDAKEVLEKAPHLTKESRFELKKLIFREYYFDAELFKKHYGIDVVNIKPNPATVKHKDASFVTFYILPCKMLNDKLLHSKYMGNIDINKTPVSLSGLDDFNRFASYRKEFIEKNLKTGE